MKSGMKLLKENKYGELLEQLNKIPFNTLFARAVLESKVSGSVFVDNTDHPKTVFIAHLYGMSLLFGDTENKEFNTSLANYMLNTNGNRHNLEYLQVYPEKWSDKLRELLDDKILNYSKLSNKYSKLELDSLIEKYRKDHIIQWGRVNFVYKNVNKLVNIESKYDIKLIDPTIYDQIKETTVIPEHFWNSKEQFLSDGIGYALIKDNNIASIAFSSCKFENELEIGIETLDKYRGNGFAKVVCETLIAYCEANGYSPLWACREENTGSYKLAKSLGFEESLILPYYELVI